MAPRRRSLHDKTPHHGDSNSLGPATSRRGGRHPEKEAGTPALSTCMCPFQEVALIDPTGRDHQHRRLLTVYGASVWSRASGLPFLSTAGNPSLYAETHFVSCDPHPLPPGSVRAAVSPALTACLPLKPHTQLPGPHPGRPLCPWGWRGLYVCFGARTGRKESAHRPSAPGVKAEATRGQGRGHQEPGGKAGVKGQAGSQPQDTGQMDRAAHTARSPAAQQPWGASQAGAADSTSPPTRGSASRH